jgi:Flp pilus assembly pilin Flp
MEYEQLRQDERHHTAVSVALVAVIITVLAAMTIRLSERTTRSRFSKPVP